MSPEKEELLRLEATGDYVFHGSGEEMETIEPRQAVDLVAGPDGPPAVFATDRADYAIFMAIVNAHNCPDGAYSSAGGTSDDQGNVQLRFSMRRETAIQLLDSATGWVYVFPKTTFVRLDSSSEFICEQAVTPLQKILVGKDDLPDDIEVSTEVAS